MKKVSALATVLIIVGALNWGLVGLFEFNVIDYVLGKTWIDRVLYVFIGFAAIYKIAGWSNKGGK